MTSFKAILAAMEVYNFIIFSGHPSVGLELSLTFSMRLNLWTRSRSSVIRVHDSYKSCISDAPSLLDVEFPGQPCPSPHRYRLSPSRSAQEMVRLSQYCILVDQTS